MNTKVVGIYVGVAVISVALIAIFNRVGAGVPESELPPAIAVGAEPTKTFFKIENDLPMTRQDGKAVKFADLRGKVTVLAQFFAVCPHCAVRNGAELKSIGDEFGSHPDFRMMCISVDPETDGIPELKAYSEALGAEPEKWWFTRSESREETHRFLEEELRFFEIRERTEQVDIDSNGRYAHDLGLILIDRDLNVVGKWPLADARSEEGRKRDPHLYDRLHDEMFARIRELLDEPVDVVETPQSDQHE
ncbi:MAG: SCO family protein [Akkermansiaceae bacterium]|jgi:protein SCO1/2|nr:SCO family protein [Akkermansiaceae bacterium]